MQYVPPELRENEGEVEAALAGTLPEDLVTLPDIRGMLHCHTNYSDGKHTVEEWLAAPKRSECHISRSRIIRRRHFTPAG